MEEAEGRETRAQPVLFLGLCPPVPGLPADPPVLPLLSHPDPVGSPESSAQDWRDQETEAGRSRSCLSAPPHSSSPRLHHPPFPLNLQMSASLEPGRGFSGGPERERARATHHLLWSSPEIRWRVVSHGDAWQGRPDPGTQDWDEPHAAWRCLCLGIWGPHSEVSDPRGGG